MSLVKARIQCSDIKRTTDVDLLSQILAEMGDFDLAISLAISHGKSPAYAMTMMYLKGNDESELDRYLY